MDYKNLGAPDRELLKKGFDDFLSFLAKRPEFKKCGVEIEDNGFSFLGHKFEFSFIYNKENHNHFHLSEVFYNENGKKTHSEWSIVFRLDTPVNAVRIVKDPKVNKTEYSLYIANPHDEDANTFVKGIFRELNTYLEGKEHKIV